MADAAQATLDACGQNPACQHVVHASNQNFKPDCWNTFLNIAKFSELTSG